MKVIVVGGGAAGFMAAITAAEAGADVTILEKSREFLGKVRISGGGRCNVTHACFDPREFATRFPRGERELIGPFQRFGARETVEWFGSHGVKLKTEEDGRMFPVTDSSQTIIDCLVAAAKAAGVKLVTGCGVTEVEPGFKLKLSTGEALECGRLLLATGGCRTDAGGKLPVSLGHTLEPPVPSLFTFHIDAPWLRELAGISVESVEVAAAGLRERGALLVTHTGLSGPAILRLSAWGARELHALDYRFPLLVNWLPTVDVPAELEKKRRAHGAKLIVSTPLLPARLWERLVDAPELRWSKLSRADQHRLVQRLTRMELPVTGKSLNKDEFVTCGGVRLREVNFKTMESRICPGLYLAGELLDIDGVTGGFNFQAAWTTGWLAGRAMAS
jgi:predicted Rossmann fold flavoprotein